MSLVFEEFLSTSEVLTAFGSRSFVAAMLRFEAALAKAQAQAGLIALAQASSIADTCKVDLFDSDKIIRESARASHLAEPLVGTLTETVRLFNKDAAQFVNFGCTFEDVISAALALIARDVFGHIEADTRAARDTLLAHASDNQSATLSRNLERIASARRQATAFKLLRTGNPDASAMGQKCSEVEHRVAAELDLEVCTAAFDGWRDAWVAAGCELGLIIGSFGKIANEILATWSDLPTTYRTCSAIASAAQRAPQRVAVLLASLPLRAQSAHGHWQTAQAEWVQLLVAGHACAKLMLVCVTDLDASAKLQRDRSTVRDAGTRAIEHKARR